MSTPPPADDQPPPRMDSDSDSSDEDEEDDPPPEDSDSDSDSDPDSGGGGTASGYAASPSDDVEEEEEEAKPDNSPEANLQRFTEALASPARRKKVEKMERRRPPREQLFDFPRDPEGWREEDLRELWADGPFASQKPGWDPVWADDDDWRIVDEEIAAGRDPPIAPFYLPYRKYYPVIPNNHRDISTPKAVIEELDRIEEFLRWVSFIFPNGSSYEGTVWDDLATGKGVYVAEEGLVRYEGEWLRNEMEGHGVVEVDIPDVEPIPGSKLEAKMRAEGRIITRDFKSPEDKEWLEMDIEDSVRLAAGAREIPFHERKEWLQIFGQKPERGRYRYAGQWKHGRMHGCGIYEVNERIIFGRFYFGEYINDTSGCDADVSTLHAGIAEVAAAKARMFTNKPDGMIREERGPYGDPQHPYFYEEEDAWMAPGFVNQFYEVPDYWKTYVEEVDQEREMWLNSFYKAPLRLPMPAELEYWWSKDESPEFVLINKEPEPDPEDPSQLIYTDDPLILHTRTGRLINFVEDEEHGVRLFWQPPEDEGEEVDPEKIEFLPLGFDEYYGRSTPVPKEKGLAKIIMSLEKKTKALFDRLDNWVEEKKKEREENQKLREKELEFVEAEICLEEELEELEDALKMKQKEEESKPITEESEETFTKADEYDADTEEDDEDDQAAPASFGTVGRDEANNGEDKPGKSPFLSLSMSLSSSTPISLVPSKLQESFLSWRRGRCSSTGISSNPKVEKVLFLGQENTGFVKLPRSQALRGKMRATVHGSRSGYKRNGRQHQLYSLALVLLSQQARQSRDVDLSEEMRRGWELCDDLSILSMHAPVTEMFTPL